MSGRPTTAKRSLAILGWFAIAANAQRQQHGIIPKGDESIRTLNLDAPCKFAAEYRRIKSDKSDPRVAFLETYSALHADEIKAFKSDPFQEPCKLISDQTTSTDAYFDSAHKFFQVYTRKEPRNYSETVTYFAGDKGHEGVVLNFIDDQDDLKIHAFAYRKGQWQDVTAQYLGPLKLAKSDFLIVPQYGRAARVLTFDPQKTANLSHKGWLIWNGETFEFSAAKSRPGWRCPDSANHLLADFFGRESEAAHVDFCR